MANPRIPSGKAEVSGRTLINPGRFKDRKGPKRTRPLGEPYAKMTDEQVAYWEEFRKELPWLNSTHRPLVRMAAILTAKMDDDEGLGLTGMKQLSSILSKLGATPADESKVNHGDGEESDPTDKFFGPH